MNKETTANEKTDGKVKVSRTRSFFDFLWKHKVSILSFIAIVYLIFFTIYSFNRDLQEYCKGYENIIKYFSQISILLFTSGIFAASLKYLQLLDIFKEQFTNYVESSQFDEKIKNNLKIITFSDDYLLKQNNLSTLWKQITLCMYKKDFPEIQEKISKKIKNHFFVKNNISYYYKNFQVNYALTKYCDKSVKIIERSSYTIVRSNTDEFEFDFSYKGDLKDTYNDQISIELKCTTTGLDHTVNKESADTSKGDFSLKISVKLSGHTEYHIERIATTIQDINIDRIRTFGSERIIDDLAFSVKHDDNVNVSVHFLGENKFYNNRAFEDEANAYINRDVFLPGQKFLLVFTLN